MKNKYLIPLILIIASVFIYSFNLNNELFWDDEEWILRNIFVHEITWDNIKFWLTNNTLAGVGLKSNYYRPFLFFTFALNYIISGAKPLGYHLVSNGIHIVNGLLVFFVIKRFDLGISKGRTSAVAFLTALIFLIHPLQTEAITYIAGRGDALVAMFMLLSLLLFYKVNTRSDLSVQGRTLYWSLSILSLVLGILSRETGIIFPFLAWALYVAFLSQDKFIKSVKTGLIKVWPYFAVVVIYGILRLTVLNFLNTLNFYSAPNIYSENLHIRLLTFLPILWGYIKLLFVPVGLHMERSAIVYTSLFQWPAWLVFLGLVALLVWLRYLYKKGRQSEFKIWLFGIMWFFICLGPVSGITPINALMYEHWLYLPMVGFWLIVSFYLVKVLEFKGPTFLKIQGRTLIIAPLIAYFAFLSYQSIQRNIVWGSEERLYRNILKYEPQSARINNNLGNLYFDKGDMEQAELYYRRAIEIDDVFAEPYYNLGTIIQSRGDTFGAIRLFEKAIEVNPNFYYPYQNLAIIYAGQGQLAKALENLEKLKILTPRNPRVYYNIALIHNTLKNKEQAIKELKDGLRYSEIDLETGRQMERLLRQLEK